MASVARPSYLCYTLSSLSNCCFCRDSTSIVIVKFTHRVPPRLRSSRGLRLLLVSHTGQEIPEELEVCSSESWTGGEVNQEVDSIHPPIPEIVDFGYDRIESSNTVQSGQIKRAHPILMGS